MSIQDGVNKLKALLNDNSTTILTSIGVVGTATTAYLTGRASFKAAELIAQKEQIAEESLSRKEKIELVWPLYISPVTVGATTIGSIIMANRMASKEVAALALASSISERAFQEYKAKVVEKLGSTKDTAIRDAVAQDRIDKNPPSREIILAGTGEVLCFDMLTGRYFQSTVETIKKAENTINYDIVNHMYASLSQFYDEIGLPATPYSDTVGWNINNRCEVKFSTVMSTDDRPCIAVDFHFLPIAEYARLY
jgi:hypothetical protein